MAAMDQYITFVDAANIVALVAPGYFALKTYSLIYSKRDKDFARTLLESVVYSLPIVSAYNLIRQPFTDSSPVVTRAAYVLMLLVFSVAVGWGFSLLRKLPAVRMASARLRLPNPDEDFLRTQFDKLGRDEYVNVVLKNGKVFSGTPQGGNVLVNGGPRQYYFNHIAWYDKELDTWEEHEGSVIIDLTEVLYIETGSPLARG